MDYDKAKQLIIDGKALSMELTEHFENRPILSTAMAITILADFHRRAFPEEWRIAQTVQGMIGDAAWEESQANIANRKESEKK